MRSPSPSLSLSLSFSSPIGGLQIRYDSSGSLPGPGLLGAGGSGEMMPPVATSIEQLLERQWNEGQNFLMQQGAQGDGEETHTHTITHSQFCKTLQQIFMSSFLWFASFLTFYQLIRCPLAFHPMPFAACLVPSRRSISHFICYCNVCRSLSVICLSKVPFRGLDSENEKKGGPGSAEGHRSSGGVSPEFVPLF